MRTRKTERQAIQPIIENDRQQTHTKLDNKEMRTEREKIKSETEKEKEADRERETVNTVKHRKRHRQTNTL